MNDSPVSIRFILFTAAFSLALIAFLLLTNFLNRDTILVFCDVGQGDGAYMRIRNRIDVIVDAGPDNSMLQCLGKYMPFYDRTVEIAILTHPQQDHYFGFLEIGKRYTIKKMLMNPLLSTNKSFMTLLKILGDKKTEVISPYDGTRIKAMDAELHFLWPEESFIRTNIKKKIDDAGSEQDILLQKIDTDSNFGESNLDPNMFSLIFTFQEHNTRVLFTGDITGEILDTIAGKFDITTDILKVPHHGSKNGLNANFLQLANPVVSVISSGRKNRYSHPSREITEMFDSLHYCYLNTAVEGNIVFSISEFSLERL